MAEGDSDHQNSLQAGPGHMRTASQGTKGQGRDRVSAGGEGRLRG